MNLKDIDINRICSFNVEVDAPLRSIVTIKGFDLDQDDSNFFKEYQYRVDCSFKELNCFLANVCSALKNHIDKNDIQ